MSWVRDLKNGPYIQRTVPNASHRLVREDTIFMKVDESLSLFDISRREPVGVRLVVNELRAHEVIDL